MERDVGGEWPQEAGEAFRILKEYLAKDPKDGGPVLALPDFNKQFVLHTDASSYVIGAVLLQKDDTGTSERLRPVSYIMTKASHAREGTKGQL